MKLSILGLGYVGTVTSACFARDGHEVIGVDINSQKVALLNDGKSPIVEEAIGDMVLENVRNGRLHATTDTHEAILNTDLSLICVGTPSNGNGSLSLHSVISACRSLAQVLRYKKDYHLIVLRSTVLPGTVNRVIIPLLEQESGKKLGSGFGLCFNPEFLREGTSVKDFYAPPFTVIGARDAATAERAQELYKDIAAPVYLTNIETAEIVKYASNAFHALKIAFANEIGTYCKTLGIDSHQVMDIFATDTKLNVSKAYLKPGFAFGGSCLPKDLRAILYEAKIHDIQLPVLQAILPSNELHLQRAIDMITSLRKKRVGLLGLSFKAGTDDMRESPLVKLTEILLGKGFELKIYDRDVSVARLIGANKEYIDREIPHLSCFLQRSLNEVIDFAEVLVIGNNDPEFAGILERRRPDQIVIDLVRIFSDHSAAPPNYKGICW